MIIKRELSGGLSFFGISEIGEAHLKNGKPNQDAVGFLALDGSFTAAVSDGIGSCERSHVGSQAAILVCKRALTEIVDEKLPFDCESIAGRIAELWTQFFSEAVSKNYSATLKAVFGHGDDIIALSVGDGLLLIFSGGGMLLSPSDDGCFANVVTDCLSYGMNASVFWTEKITKRNDTVIFLCTDGVSNVLTQGREQEFIREIAAQEDIAEFERDVKGMLIKMAEFNSDDKTIGVVKL
jgi:serine/threonine protein phosphatase PrpC